jgi:hypothetical protein
MQVFGIVLVVAGMAIRYWINKRAFDRRAITGLEGFKSYGEMRLTRLFEGILRFVSLLVIIGGIILFLLSLVSPYGIHHPVHHN